MPEPVLLLGATGLFGGHLARQLSTRDDIALTVAGRSLSTLTPLASELGASPLAFDRTDLKAVAAALTQLEPFAVIDCSGPFQNYGTAPYAFAEAVLNAGAHYLDIADGAEFVAGITALDVLAKEKGLCAWSGASTTPALSSAIAADLSVGLDDIELIETSIVPGNKTPRGLSVMQAILGQVGRPFPRRRGGRIETAYGWADSTRVAPQVGDTKLKPRLAALVNTPDAALFPQYFNAATVTARAGLELPLFHRALSVARYIVPAFGVTSLDRLSKPLLALSNQFLGFGSDAGGMRVRVQGSAVGIRQERVWDMIIPDGHGPKTPVQPAAILLDQLLSGRVVAGARPALAAFTRAEAEAQLATIHARFERRDRDLTPIFAQALSADFDELLQPVKALHSPAHVTRFKGVANIETATTLLGKIAAICGGFPLKGGQVPAKVEIVADGQSEKWTRDMGGKTFRSVLRYDPLTGMTETFGPLTFGLDLTVSNGELLFPVTNGRAFGIIPIPRFLTPISETRESVDAEGRFRFDVRLSLPNGALIVHYKGHLEPQ
ncbi:Saccharopine dehydrogenase NADP binding domain-containing protein [Litoreibacter ascidiaceicola]|uniref:Saccharopine dehydrogenase NADP binding domain-containing protein n=1 Tax=Litoreibacter ascidiaceicola TaxID=1486859 RepID=A0A1M4U0S1_9RHOB|nr:SDR family oxidoreductase [Litoreibacter ascidiaceicola]SHE50371.1 Saccharopine dehydrogenase NADP binding domain-containing protein [Litoreibacter ascidiaceicola]